MCIRDSLVTHRHTEVQDGQEHEYVRLDGTDEHVERLPDDLANRYGLDLQQHRNDQNHYSASEEVAKETEGHRDGLDDLLNHVDWAQREERLLVVTEVPAYAAGPERLDVHPHNDNERHRERKVDVTGRRGQDFRAYARVHRRGQQAHPVADEDEDEYRDPDWNEPLVLRADRGLRQIADDVDDNDLVDQLEFAGHAIGDLAAHEQTEDEEDHGRNQR